MAIRITLRGWSRALAALAAAALARDGGDEARFPVCSLAAALAGTVALVGWLAWSGLARDRSSDAVTAQVVRTAELRGVLAHLDEVLTMSARMAAVTGDPR